MWKDWDNYFAFQEKLWNSFLPSLLATIFGANLHNHMVMLWLSSKIRSKMFGCNF
jgi:hypothetical protein